MPSDFSVFFLLLNNISVFVVLVYGYSQLIERLQGRTALVRQLVLGLFFGLITFVSMHVKIPVVEGVIVDQRNALIVLSGAFGGPLAALVCGVMAGVFRAYLGGAGMVAGIFGVTLSALFGVALYMVLARANSVAVLFLGAIFAVLFTAPGFLLVGDLDYGWALLQRMIVPWGMAIFIGIFLGGLLLSREDRLLKSNREKKTTEAQFRTLYEGTVIPILDMDFSEVVAELKKLHDQAADGFEKSIRSGGLEIENLDRRVIVRQANPAARRLYRATNVQDMLGRFDGRYGPQHGGIHPNIAEGFLRGEGNITFESVHKTFDGEVLNVSVSMPVPGPLDGPPEAFTSIPVTILDVTQQKKAEASRDAALISAEEASRTKSEFLAAMSHELRTPLNAILGFSEIIANQMLGDAAKDKYAEYGRHIHASGELLLDLVNDILDIAAIEAGRKVLTLTEVDLGEVVDECLAIVEHRAQEAGVTLTKDIDALKASAITADRRALQQVLLNLLTNAVKNTPSGGEVSVSARNRNNAVEILVRDTGRGIPQDRLDEVTAPFVRGNDNPHVAQEGWGLGLSIAKSLVELHDGSLDIESSIGDGTMVRITLPRQG